MWYKAERERAQFIKYSREDLFYEQLDNYFQHNGIPAALSTRAMQTLKEYSTNHATYSNPAKKQLIETLHAEPETLHCLLQTYHFDYSLLGFSVEDSLKKVFKNYI